MTEKGTSRNWLLRRLLILVLVLAGLVVSRRAILFTPPGARGLWIEASFLADTNFDYRRLREREQNPIRGGARFYVTSILPTIAALMIVATPTPEASFAFYRLFNFACTGIILILVFEFLRPVVGKVAAILACLAVLTTPLFSVQVDRLGMEIPVTAAALATTYAAWRERYGWAAILGTIASLVKFTGTIATLAVLGFLCLQVIVPVVRTAPMRCVWIGLACNFLSLGVQLFVFWYSGYDHAYIRPTGL